MATVRIGHASKDENGTIKNGAAGDQTGKEVCTRDWYLNGKGWVALYCPDDEIRERIAQAMERACANDKIGYDQWQRDTLWNHVKGKGWDPAKATNRVETDCSALVRVCIAYAFQADVVGNIRTVNEPDALVNSGHFVKLTDDKYCKSSDYLRRGTILCTPVSGHTVVVLSDGAKVSKNTTTTTQKEGFEVNMNDLKKGSKGKQVKTLQALLIGYGYDCGKYGVDGDYGADTQAAVKEYQKANGLTVDGKVGSKTWAKLLGV